MAGTLGHCQAPPGKLGSLRFRQHGVVTGARRELARWRKAWLDSTLETPHFPQNLPSFLPFPTLSYRADGRAKSLSVLIRTAWRALAGAR